MKYLSMLENVGHQCCTSIPIRGMQVKALERPLLKTKTGLMGFLKSAEKLEVLCAVQRKVKRVHCKIIK